MENYVYRDLEFLYYMRGVGKGFIMYFYINGDEYY